jgi:hypothetical protein
MQPAQTDKDESDFIIMASTWAFMQGTYIKQNTRPLMNASSMPLKTYETHRFFAAWADESPEVMSWDPDQIPSSLQFTHRGFDQVITAKVCVCVLVVRHTQGPWR